MDYVKSLISKHDNFPKAGITFFDIHPVMADAKARRIVLDAMLERYKPLNIQAVVGV